MKIRLRFSTGSLRGQAPLRDITEGASVTIGRAEDNAIALDPGVDVAASSYHAQFYMTGGQLYLYDLNSTNGTFVNRQRITAVAVQPGDRIAFGHPGVGPECDLEMLPDAAPVTGATSPLHAAAAGPATTAPMAPFGPATTSPLMAGASGGSGMATHAPFNYSGAGAPTSAMSANVSTAPLMSAQPSSSPTTSPGTPALQLGPVPEQAAPAAASVGPVGVPTKCQLCGSKLDDRAFVCYGCKMNLCWVHYDPETGMCRTCVALGRGGSAPAPAVAGPRGRLDLDSEPAADVPPGQVACASPGCGFVGDPVYTFNCYGCQRVLCGHHYGDAGYCKDCASGGGPAPVAAAAEPSGSGRFKTTRPMSASGAGGPADDELPPRRRRPSGDGDDLPPRRGRR